MYKKAKYLSKIDGVIECGGVAGELYKNGFINQDTPFLYGPPNWKKFIEYKVITYRFPEQICGSRIKQMINEMPTTILKWLEQFDNRKKSKAYISAGYKILQQRSSAISVMGGYYYGDSDGYSPMLERNVVAYAYQTSPHKLGMQSFQRNQVSKNAPELKNIRTDRGLTCNSSRRAFEWVKSNIFLMKVYFERTFCRKKSGGGRIDACFESGLKSEEFAKAIDKCKEMGIINKEVSYSDIPSTIADRLFLIGTVFIDD